MTDRKGWTKEPVSRAGWTKAPATVESDDGEQPVDTTDSLDVLKPDRPLGAFVAGVNQGATLGFGDEISGAAGVGAETLHRAGQGAGLVPQDVVDADPSRNPNGPEIKKSWGPSQPAGAAPVVPETADRVRPSLADVYRGIRDADRTRQKESERAQPLAHGTGELLGAVALPMPGSGLMKGAPLAAKMGLGAAQAAGMGAVIGVGKSEKEDLEGMRNDGLVNGAIAAPLGAGGAALAHGVGKLADRFGGRAGEVKAAKAAKDAEEMLASRSGQYSKKVQDAHRTVENIQTKLKDPNISEEWKTQARMFLDSDEGRGLVNQIAENQLENAPAKMGQMSTLKALWDSAPEDAAKQTADYFSKSTLKEDVLPRVKNYVSRMIPQAVGDAIGDFAGGAKGVAAGFAGALSGAALGKPGTSFGNLMQKTPRFNAQLFEALEKGSLGLERALGQSGPAFAAQTTAEGRQRILEQAMEDPATASAVQSALEQNQSRKPDLRQRFGG